MHTQGSSMVVGRKGYLAWLNPTKKSSGPQNAEKVSAGHDWKDQNTQSTIAWKVKILRVLTPLSNSPDLNLIKTNKQVHIMDALPTNHSTQRTCCQRPDTTAHRRGLVVSCLKSFIVM